MDFLLRETIIGPPLSKTEENKIFKMEQEEKGKKIIR